MIRSCGSVVSACTSALASWLAGAKSNSLIVAASCRRSNGTSSGGVASAALVHTPAWTDSASTRPCSICGTMNKSSGTRRWTFDRRLALTINGARAAFGLEPGESARVAVVGEQIAGALAADAELFAVAAVTMMRDVTEQRQHAAGEPAQQRGAFGIVHAVGVRLHPRGHLRPVGDRRADVGQRRRERLSRDSRRSFASTRAVST